MFRLPKNFKKDLLQFDNLFESMLNSSEEEWGNVIDIDPESFIFKKLIVVYDRLYNFSFYFYFNLILTQKEINSETFSLFEERFKPRTHQEMLMFNDKELSKELDCYDDLKKFWNIFTKHNENYYLLNYLLGYKKELEKYKEEFCSCIELPEEKLSQRLEKLTGVYNWNLRILVEYIFVRQELFKTMKNFKQFDSLRIGVLDIIFTLDRETINYLFLLVDFNRTYVLISKSYLSKSDEIV